MWPTFGVHVSVTSLLHRSRAIKCREKRMQKSISSCIVPLRFGRIATETKKVPEIIPAHFLACMVNKITFFLALHACTHTWILLDVLFFAQYLTNCSFSKTNESIGTPSVRDKIDQQLEANDLEKKNNSNRRANINERPLSLSSVILASIEKCARHNRWRSQSRKLPPLVFFARS